jgi:hypothetical protein
VVKPKQIEPFAKEHLFNNSSVKKQNREQKQTNASLRPQHWQCTEQFGQLCLASDFTCMRIASSTLQNCGISYFIFDDIASLAGSADTQNVDPVILSNICIGFRNENPSCIDLCFLGVEARQRAEGINIVPRMVQQVQHFDVCSIVNNRQTGAMTLQVKTHTNSVSDINIDLEKVEGLCFPLLFPHVEPGYTNSSKSRLSPDECHRPWLNAIA